MARRIRDIHPESEVLCRQEFFSAENADSFPFDRLDYVVDAIGSVSFCPPVAGFLAAGVAIRALSGSELDNL